MSKQQPTMMVTGKSMDDIGSVLTTLGFEWSPYDATGFEGNQRPDVLFVNCGSPTLRNDLASFVHSGGVVYISDHAKHDYESIVSDIGKSCTISLAGNAGTHNATVVDQHLAAFLEVDSLALEFDMPSWAVVQSPPAGASRLIEVAGKPVVMTLKHGLGSVIFTSFHNSAQNSDIEKQLIRFLALKPLMKSKSIRTVKETTKRGGKISILDELEPVVSASKPYRTTYKLPKRTTSFHVELNWLGEAEVHISCSSGGGNLKSGSARMAPLRVSVDTDTLSSGSVDVEIRLAGGTYQALLTSMVCSVTESDADDRESLRSLMG
jgi:hypothetical protein